LEQELLRALGAKDWWKPILVLGSKKQVKYATIVVEMSVGDDQASNFLQAAFIESERRPASRVATEIDEQPGFPFFHERATTTDGARPA